MKIVRFFLAIGMAWAILRMIDYRENGYTGVLEWTGWGTFAWCVLLLLGIKLVLYLLAARRRRKGER
ncbi:MAG: hypothetical protein LBF09_06595 [Odoribacteraceae bacterium]|jgi:hypothetical protein|nr:hypothetical protein [Odoribacteraceae bacterium]